MTYCTGGIRCEKFSGYLLREGFEDVVQLDGGIVKYSKDENIKGENFEGQLYVFDKRIGIPVNEVNPTIVARCLCCNEPSERYINCMNKDCNLQHFLFEACEPKTERFCCDECKEIIALKIAEEDETAAIALEAAEALAEAELSPSAEPEQA